MTLIPKLGGNRKVKIKTKVSTTIADLDGVEAVNGSHISERFNTEVWIERGGWGKTLERSCKQTSQSGVVHLIFLSPFFLILMTLELIKGSFANVLFNTKYPWATLYTLRHSLATQYI